MKQLQNVSGLVAALALVVIVLITSFEIGIYSDDSWYQREYEKYQVLDDLEMEMQDVMHVTEEMLAYLRGDRENLEVETVVNKEKRLFFNEREKLHMEDVQRLFLGGLKIRRIAGILFIASLLAVFFLKGSLRKILPQMYGWAVVLFLGGTAALGGLIAVDFNKYFVLFHKIFFTNDLWLLDPDTDLMIRMLPEGFFSDMVARIGGIFITSLLLLWIAGLLWKHVGHKKSHGINNSYK